MAEEIFDDLDLNPIIITDDTTEIVDDDDNNDNKDKDNLKNKDPKKTTTELVIDDDDEDPDKTPINTDNVDDGDGDKGLGGLEAWVTFYKEKGLISEEVDESEITDVETLFDKLKEQQLVTANALIESYKSQIPKHLKDALDSWEEGADGDALKKILETKAELINLENLNEESLKDNVEYQKNVVKTYLKKTTKYSDEKIDKYVKKLEDLEELEEEAKTNITELKTILAEEEASIKNEAKERAKKEREQAIARRDNLINNIKKLDTVVDTIKVTDTDKKALESLMLNPVAKDSQGNPVFYLQKLINDNPDEMMIKLNYLAHLTKGFTDFTKIVKKAESKANEKLEKLLEIKPPKGGNSGKGSDKKDFKDNLKNIIFQ